MAKTFGVHNPDRFVPVCICCDAKNPQKFGLWCDKCWSEMNEAEKSAMQMLKADRRENEAEHAGK